AHPRLRVSLQRWRPAFAAARRPDPAHPPRGHEHGSDQTASLRSGLDQNQGQTTFMPRIPFVEESNLDPEARGLIASAERTGAPDPRVVRIMVRSSAGRAWVKCWNSVLYEGRLPHKLKEMCRIRISVAHKCGYCSTVRSNVARAEGLTEDLVDDLLHEGARLSPREKAALEYADLFKSGDEAIDSD